MTDPRFRLKMAVLRKEFIPMKTGRNLATLVVLLGLGPLAVAEPPRTEGPSVRSSPTPTTRLFVRTIPAGAEIKLDGRPRGKSDRLIKVPPGVRKMTIEVEFDGHYSKRKEVEIRGGQITRVKLELERKRHFPILC